MLEVFGFDLVCSLGRKGWDWTTASIAKGLFLLLHLRSWKLGIDPELTVTPELSLVLYSSFLLFGVIPIEHL